jgi:hypothetical protein
MPSDQRGGRAPTEEDPATNTDTNPDTNEAGSANFTGGVGQGEGKTTAEYLRACFGEAKGYVFVGLGHNIRRLPSGRYEYKPFKEIGIEWPGNSEALAHTLIEAARQGIDVHICPYLMRENKRSKGGAVERRTAHTDLDKPEEINQDRLVSLVGHIYVVESGSPDHYHVYCLLTRSVPQPQHEILCRGLGAYIGGADRAKVSDNDYLRPPGTLNRKPTVDGGEPNPVTWMIGPHEAQPIDPEELAEILGVDLDAAEKAQTNGQSKTKASGQGGTGEKAETEEFDLDKYPTVKAAMNKNGGDRSAHTFHVMAACYRAGLRLAQACWAVYQSPRPAERLQERKEDDVVDLGRVWHRVVDDEQRQRQEKAEGNRQDGEGANPGTTRIIDGATFILSAPETIPAIWGRNDEVLWAEGESLMITGGLGLGKTTLAGLLVRAMLCGGEVLGFPVMPAGEPILYLAMDRPRQIARSMRRQFGEQHQRWLSERLRVWPGPLPDDVAKNPDLLVGKAREAEARYVFLDSLKDAVIGLSDDAVAAVYNRARQLLIADDRQLCELHHPVKRASGESTDDAYGSRWLTAGAGSVIMLSGKPGDPIIRFRHTRQPAAEVGPYKLISYQDTGEIAIYHAVDLVELAKAGKNGLTVKDAACALSETDKPDPNDIEKARRRLNKLVDTGKLRQVEGHRGGSAGEGEARWYPV